MSFGLVGRSEEEASRALAIAPALWDRQVTADRVRSLAESVGIWPAITPTVERLAFEPWQQRFILCAVGIGAARSALRD